MKTPKILCGVLLACAPCFATVYTAATSAELYQRIALLHAGDTLRLAQGVFDSVTLFTASAGEPGRPIVLRGAGEGRTILDQANDSLSGEAVGGARGSLITIRHGYWILEDMTLRNSYDMLVQFQYHTPNVILRRLELTTWGCYAVKPYVYFWNDSTNTVAECGPDSLLAEDIYAHHERPGNSSRGGPGNVFDLLGGDDIRIRNCYLVCSYENYAGFVKANSSRSIFENNIVKNGGALAGYGVGWSLGGGLTGTGRHWFKYDDETWEARNSLVRNNVFVNMADACVHANKALNTEVYHNTFVAGSGGLYVIQVNSNSSNAILKNNLYAGTASPSRSGTMTQANNVTTSGMTWFQNPIADDYRIKSGTGAVNACPALPQVTADFNGFPRDSQPDAGAFELGSVTAPEKVALPAVPFVLSARPNPASGIVQVQFLVTEKKGFSLEIFNLRGERVRRMDLERVMYGVNTAEWDGSDKAGKRVPDGVYLLRVVSGGKSWTTRVIKTR